MMKSFSTRMPSACMNRHERRRGFPCHSGFDRINKEVHKLDALTPTGLSNRENAFYKTTAGFTLSSKTALSPKHTFSQNSFCGVIGWFNAFNRDKGPQSFPMPEDIFTHTFGLFVSAPKATSKKSFHSGFKRNKLLRESLPGYFSVLKRSHRSNIRVSSANPHSPMDFASPPRETIFSKSLIR